MADSVWGTTAIKVAKVTSPYIELSSTNSFLETRLSVESLQTIFKGLQFVQYLTFGTVIV